MRDRQNINEFKVTQIFRSNNRSNPTQKPIEQLITKDLRIICRLLDYWANDNRKLIEQKDTKSYQKKIKLKHIEK